MESKKLSDLPGYFLNLRPVGRQIVNVEWTDPAILRQVAHFVVPVGRCRLEAGHREEHPHEPIGFETSN
jgi:hypothetical protein